MATVKPISIFSRSVKHSTVSLFEYEGLPVSTAFRPCA